MSRCRRLKAAEEKIHSEHIVPLLPLAGMVSNF